MSLWEPTSAVTDELSRDPRPRTETPCDPPPLPRAERRARMSRIAAGLGVGIMGAASLTTAVYQTTTQASTALGMPGAVDELHSPLPWAAVPAAAGPALPPSTTITPTVADLALRADQQPLPSPPAPAAGPAPAGPALAAAAPEPGTRAAPPARGTARPSSPGTSPGSTRPTSSTGSSTAPPSSPTSSPEPTTPSSPSESPSETPSESPSESPSEAPSSAPSSGTEPTGGTTTPSGVG
ncbi:hypothetical protein PHK61_27530 [Actinomycetospora lutea]|uniref:hypothetical protein n=1 Tax=Actinomycetospora lutea TaxID=663604 RepID=UPI002365E425|nr:hypothetical protein [Actinomycetospora lutea]MDD7942172.1 hypothetical protein [Actinomycetospora lutea]